MNSAITLLMILYLFITLIIFLISQKYNSWYQIMWLYIIGIAVVAFIYMPLMNKGGDFYQYFNYVQDTRGMTLNEANNYFNSLLKDNLYIRNFIFWLVGNYFNFHVLPAFTTATVFGVGFYIIGDFSKVYNSQQNMWLILLFEFITLPFFSILANMRNIFAFSLVILAAYREFIQNKKNLITYFLYIFPCFYHSAAIILVLLRLLSPLAKKGKYIVPFIIFLLPGIIDFLYTRISSLPEFVIPLVEKGYGYLNNTIATAWGNAVNSSTFFTVQKYLMVFFAVLSVILILLTNKNSYLQEKNYNEDNFFYFNFLIWLMTISCVVFPSPHYWRFYTAGILTFSPNIIRYTNKWYKLNVFSKIILVVLVMLSILLALLFIKNTFDAY